MAAPAKQVHVVLTPERATKIEVVIADLHERRRNAELGEEEVSAAKALLILLDERYREIAGARRAQGETQTRPTAALAAPPPSPEPPRSVRQLASIDEAQLRALYAGAIERGHGCTKIAKASGIPHYSLSAWFTNGRKRSFDGDQLQRALLVLMTDYTTTFEKEGVSHG